MTIYRQTLSSPIGSFIAISNQDHLLSLYFAEKEPPLNAIRSLLNQNSENILEEWTAPIQSIQQELSNYFAGSLKKFITPMQWCGTPFQQTVWETLYHLPDVETASYHEIAKRINRPTAYRAVANAIRSNPFAIIVPCHRILASNGALTGYYGGLEKKAWLLQHEAAHY